MQILDASKNNNQFDGVTVKGSLPELFHGMDFAYFIQDDRFCKAEPDFMEKAKPLSDLSRNGQFHFQMGRNTLSNFTTMYCPSYRILLILRKKILKNSGSI